VLGPNRKYSSCAYKEPASTLQEVEEEALRQTVEHADLATANRSSNPPLGSRAVDGAVIPASAGISGFQPRIRSANISRAKPRAAAD
jgi:hypothetical protein